MIETAIQTPKFSFLGERNLAGETIITRMMAEALARPELLSLAAGFTDNAVLPVDLIESALLRINRRNPARGHLQYGKNDGLDQLREATIELLQSYPGEEHLPLVKDEVLIANGSQQALYISVQLFCEPGDIVLVEDPSYFVFLELLRGLGVEAVAMPAREDGRTDLDALANLLESMENDGRFDRVKLLYYMGVYANPTSRCWLEEDKRSLAGIMKSLPRAIPVIEDMAYRELWFTKPWSARSALSLPEWEDYPLLYTGTFTKPFATGLKTGFVASRWADWLTGISRVKGHQDFGSAHLNQAIIAEVMESGAYSQFLGEIRPHYERKMDTLYGVLQREGLEDLGWRFERPEGGLLLWAEGPEGFDTSLESRFHRAALNEDVIYVPGNLCYAAEKPANSVRLSFGALSEPLLDEAATRFVRAVRQVQG